MPTSHAASVARFAVPGEIASQIASLIASLGDPGFEDAAMAAFHALSGADMCSAFAILDGAPHIVLAASMDPDRSAFARIASLRYAETYWRRDTTALSTLGRAHRKVQTVRRPSAVIRDVDYRHECYAEGAVVERISILRTGPVALIANAYRDRDSGPFEQSRIEALEAVAPLIAACIEHHVRLGESAAGRPCEAGSPAHIAPSVWRAAGLSAREKEVLAHLACGATQEEISRRLNLAPSSIITYRRRGYAKLGVKSRSDLRARLHEGGI